MKKITTLFILLALAFNVHAQSIGIGTTSPDTSAALEINSTSKGFLMPRLTTAQRNTIASPADGLQIFNTDDGCIDSYQNGKWAKTCGLKSNGPAIDPGHPTTNSWFEKFPFGGTARMQATAVSMGTKAYVGLGYYPDSTNSNNIYLLRTWWEFAANQWTRKADFPKAIFGAASFAIGTKIYVGTGKVLNNPIGTGTTYTNEFWEYNTLTNVWTQKANLPANARTRAVGFSLNGMGYFYGGEIFTNTIGYVYYNDMWEYNPTSNTWTQKNPVPTPANGRGSAVAFTIGNKAYIGTGGGSSFYNSNDFFAYDPALNTFSAIASIPGISTKRYSAIGFVLNGRGYVGTGETNPGARLQDFWEYNPINNSWTQKANFGFGVESEAVGFSIGPKGYIASGLVGGNELWEYMDNNQTGGEFYSSASTLSTSPINLIADANWSSINYNIYNNNTGNIGLGTDTPKYKLDIAGSFGVKGNAIIKGNTTLNGTLSTTGNTVIGGYLSALGLNISENLLVGGSTTTHGLTNHGNSSFNGNSSFDGNSSFNGDANVEGSIRTKYSGTLVRNVSGGTSTIFLTIPALPIGWDFTNTMILVSNVDGQTGTIYQAKLLSSTIIQLYFTSNSNTASLARFNYIIFKL
jgi:N-acetylneuraminic acid mutarotase